MSDKNYSPRGIWPLVWKPALAGIACGALFGVAGELLNQAWQNEYCNTNLALFINLPPLAIFLLLLLLSAFLAVILTRRNVRRPAETLLPGAIAGVAFLVSAMFFSTLMTLIALSPLFVAKEPGTYNMFDGFIEDPLGYFIGFFTIGAPVIAVYSLIAMAAASMAGMAYAYLLSKQPGGEKKIKSTDRWTVAIALTMVALFTVLPPAIAALGLSTGWLEGSYHDYIDCVSVKRLGDGALRIDYTGGPNLRLDKGQPFIININGNETIPSKNATNMEAIARSGLSATIDPGAGLKSEKGSYVILSGPDVMPRNINGYSGTHVTISAVLSRGDQMMVFDYFIK